MREMRAAHGGARTRGGRRRAEAPSFWFRGVVALAAAALSGGPAQASELYSYVDEDGVLHLTNVREAARGRGWRVYEGSGPEGFGGKRPVVIELEGRERVAYPVDVTDYDDLFREAARHYRLPFAFLKAVAKVESNFDPRAVSRADAKGLMQLIDATAKRMRVSDPFDPRQSIFGGARYLRHLANAFDGDLVRTTAAYNAGPERVVRAGGVPNIQETRRYVRRVLEMYRHYRLVEQSAW